MLDLGKDEKCPCGSDKKFGECCGQYLLEGAKPKTAEALMRSRYSAFVIQKVSYLVETHHTETRKDLDESSLENWAKGAEWDGLEILVADKGQEFDTEGTVEFSCRYYWEGKLQIHHEVSTFKKEGGVWRFYDGQLKDRTIRRDGEKIGRNDPCKCGSGKKFKKCCG